MDLDLPAVGNGLLEIFLPFFLIVETFDSITDHSIGPLLPSPIISKGHHQQNVGRIDEDFIDFFDTEACGLRVKEVNRGNDTSSNHCPDKIKLPSEGCEANGSSY